MFYGRKAFFRRKTSLVVPALLLAVSIAHSRPLTRSEVGELFIFGLSQAAIDPATEAHLKSSCPGSILLFRRNLKSNLQVVQLTEQLRLLHRGCSKHPLLIGLDQEGGQVARIPFDPPMPSPWSVGVTRNTRISEELGYQVGLTLRSLGFNLNLAPVLDLGQDGQKTFIGSRSYGSDPDLVGRMGTSFSLGLIRSRVLPIAKHFPGIGSVPNDPHQVMVRRPASADLLWKKDLKPFQEFTQLFPTGVMPSHLIYPQADHSEGPGTFSKVLLRDWLREKLNYRGLVISDDLLMKGAQENRDLGHNVVIALRAGVDLVMVSWSIRSQQRAVQAVLEALKDGRLEENAVREKILRIRKIKQIVGEPKLDKRARADRLLLIGTQRYADLTYTVLRKNLGPQLLHLNLHKPRRVFQWPSDLRSRWQIERILHQTVYDSSSTEFQKIQPGDMIIAFVRNKKEARSLLKWPLSTRKKTLVINQVEPGLFDSSFAAEVGIYLQHPMLASEIAKGLQHKWGPSLISKAFDD
jgi:beta-N-acetylhexosaminidase